MTILAVLVSAVVAFVLSGAYYALLGDRLARLSPAYAGPSRPAALTAAVELLRNVVLAAVLAGLATGPAAAGPGPAVLLALMLWIAFPVVLLAGSVFHERVPALLATIHAGDWAVKLLVITLIVALWR